MKINFVKCDFSELYEFISEYKALLSSPMDSFLEDHIIESEHFLITIDDNRAGYFSVYKKELLTQFYLSKEYRYLGQEIFYKIKKVQYINKVFVSTGDEFFLSHALDEYRSVEKQAYFFKDSMNQIKEDKIDRDLSIRVAEHCDIEEIQKNSGSFFDNLNESISNEEIYIVSKDSNIVGFGVMEKGIIMKGYVSIGMYTVEAFRQKGIGRNILLMLKEIAYKKNLKPIAGCWYFIIIILKKHLRVQECIQIQDY